MRLVGPKTEALRQQALFLRKKTTAERWAPRAFFRKTEAVPQQVVFLCVQTEAVPKQALFLRVKTPAERTAGACKPKNACAAAAP